MIGVTIFAEQFPSFIFSLLGGIVSDRYNRYKVLLVTQTASMIQAILLSILILTHHYVVWEILSLSVMLGIINAFDVPARQPLVHEMVNDKADLPNAVALNSSLVNLARLIGPALSGIIIESFGAGICFLLNALSFVAILTCLFLMRLPAYTPPPAKKKVLAELVDGFVYMRRTPVIGLALLMLTLISLLVLPYNALLPVFAKIVFKGNAATFGYISSFIGAGALAGAMFLASLKPGTNLKWLLLVNTIILGLAMICFSHINYFPLAMVFAVLCGFGTMSQTTICNTIIQVESAHHMRGRVMSFLVMAMFGMLPLGSLLIGAISEQIGAPNTILSQGIVALLIAISFSGFLAKEKLTRKEMAQMKETETEIAENI